MVRHRLSLQGFLLLPGVNSSQALDYANFFTEMRLVVLDLFCFSSPPTSAPRSTAGDLQDVTQVVF